MAKGKSGAFSVTMKDGEKLTKKLQKLEDGGKTAIKRTVSDFKSRAPAWVSKGIREHYAVNIAGIKKAGPRIRSGASHVHISGISVDNATLEYKGEKLTATHFEKYKGKANPKGFEPQKRLIPGQYTSNGGAVVWARKPKKYSVQVKIVKGELSTLPKDTFIGNGLPFQRTAAKRTKMKPVRHLAVPQMIDGDRARETVYDLIEENLEKRFEHNVQKEMK